MSPTTAAHVRAELGTEIDLILDGGACTVGIESTIVDLTATHPRILRPGGVSRERIEAVLGIALVRDTTVDRRGIPRVSGSLASHYAPTTPVLSVDAAGGDAALRAAAADVAAVGVIALAFVSR